MAKTFIGEDSIIIDKYIYSQFIPYASLQPIVSPVLSNLNKPIINVFIDLYSMTIPLYQFYNYINPLSLTSCLANAAIHYRNYFRKYNVYANVFLLYSPTMSANNLRYCQEYNMKNIETMFKNQEVKQLVDQNLELLGTISPYLPDIFFRIGTVETAIMATDMMLQFATRGFDTNALFVTSSPIAFQIPTIYPKAIVFCKRHNGNVMVVDKTNALSSAIEYTRNQVVDISGINQSWVSGYYTLCGLSKREVKSLTSYKTALKIFNNMTIKADIMNPDSLYIEFINCYNGKNKDPKKILDLIHNRFRCFDFKQQLLMYQSLPEYKETAYLSQLQDWEELLHLNDRYFKDNPMQLDLL